MKTPAYSIINDEQSLVSAKSRFGHSIPVYDDGFGPLFMHRDSMGITAIIRAQTWEDAYSICEDEFFPAADAEAFEKPYDEMTDHERACWDEAYGYRGNARKEKDGSLSTVYAKDLNGDNMIMLTPELLGQFGITLEIEKA